MTIQIEMKTEADDAFWWMVACVIRGQAHLNLVTVQVPSRQERNLDRMLVGSIVEVERSVDLPFTIEGTAKKWIHPLPPAQESMDEIRRELDRLRHWTYPQKSVESKKNG